MRAFCVFGEDLALRDALRALLFEERAGRPAARFSLSPFPCFGAFLVGPPALRDDRPRWRSAARRAARISRRGPRAGIYPRGLIRFWGLRGFARGFPARLVVRGGRAKLARRTGNILKARSRARKGGPLRAYFSFAGNCSRAVPRRYEHAAVPVRFSLALLEGGIGDRKGLSWERSQGMQGGPDLHGAICASYFDRFPAVVGLCGRFCEGSFGATLFH